MKRAIVTICGLALIAALALNVMAQTGTQTEEAKQKTERAKETAKTKKAATPTDDAGIQKCISDRLAASARLKDLGLTATVSNGEATLTGSAKNSGQKASAATIARRCGAKKVTNNITVEAATKAKPATSETKKP